MANSKKRHPTWHDVSEAKNQGVELALTIVLTVLRDNFSFDEDQTIDFMNRIGKLSEEIKEGRVNVKDLKRVQLEEYNTQL